jgi:very-short-patch-repair endonuclease
MPFQNPVLQKLLDGALDNKAIQIAKNLNEHQRISDALNNLPIALSENQKRAISNAWEFEISYIQGPPGTGKSHTITALMLSAILLRKKVLLISHKAAAVNVVSKKVNEFLGNDFGMIKIDQNTETRNRLRTHLQQILNTVPDTGLWGYDSQLKDLDKTIWGEKAKLEEQRSKLKQLLTQANKFYEKNREFVDRREKLISNFGKESLPDSFEFDRHDIDLGKASLAVERAKTLLSSKRLPRKHGIFIAALFKSLCSQLRASRAVLTKYKTQYAEEYLEILQAFRETQVNLPDLATDLTILRNRIGDLEDNLKGLQKEFLQKVFERNRYDALENCRQSVDSVDLFQKMLRLVKPNLISEKMAQIDYGKLTDVFPLWGSELRYLGRWLPMQSGIFDLVVVDEASQVNLAEIIPAFYRGKHFCVVGDEMQLNLNAAGLFKLNSTFEELTWNKHFNPHDISYESGKEKNLIVSKSSILDFIISPSNNFSIPFVMLNEHFRSLPQLAKFTSEKFYQDRGGLRIMTELPEHIHKRCFEAIYVNGERAESENIVPKEVEKTVELLKELIKEKAYMKPPLSECKFSESIPPSIGVLAFLTDTKNKLKEKIEGDGLFQDNELKMHDLFIATTEEFQGNERNIMIIVMGLSQNHPYAPLHFENPNRFNVATSRATHFAYLIYGGLPKNARLPKDYLLHFGFEPNIRQTDAPEYSFALRPDLWGFDEKRLESEFEIRVCEYLKEFEKENNIRLFNQVESCGYRLDFVLYNSQTKKCVAVEVDGKQHFTANGRDYHTEHLERVEILNRAGWRIVHIPYYRWYRNGWICDRNNSDFDKNVVRPMFEELHKMLF